MGDHDGILLEDINHKLDAILEGQQAMAYVPGAVAGLQTDMRDVKSRLTNVEYAVTGMSRSLDRLSERVDILDKSVGGLDERVGGLEQFAHDFLG